MLSYESRVEALRSEYERLARHLRSLDSDQMAASSACDGWTTADVTAHLAWNARLYVRSLSMGLAGEELQPSSGSGDAPKITGDYVRARAIELRKKLSEDLLDSFEEHNARFISMLDQAEAGVRQTLTVPFLDDVISLQRLVGLRINEVALHSWDVRNPWDGSAELFEDAAAASVELWRDTIHRRLRSGSGARVRIGPAGGDPFDVVDCDGAPTAEAAKDTPDATLAGSSSAIALFLSGRARLEGGPVEIGGDHSAADEFEGRLRFS